MFTPLPTARSRVPRDRNSKDRGLAPAASSSAPRARTTGARAKKPRRVSSGRPVKSRFLQDAIDKGRKKKEALRNGSQSSGRSASSSSGAGGKVNRQSLGGARAAQRPGETHVNAASGRRSAGRPSSSNSKSALPHGKGRAKTTQPKPRSSLLSRNSAAASNATATSTAPTTAAATSVTTTTDATAPAATNAPKVTAGGPSDSVRDLHERLMMSQTTIMQWLYATARLDDTIKIQVDTMHRQIYAVWRATQQALSTTSHLERLLLAAKIARERKNALTREHRALAMVGAMDSTKDSNEHHQLMVKARDEFKTFAKALSKSMAYIPVSGMTATTSSNSPLFENALRDLKKVTEALEKAVSGEAATVATVSQAWVKLATAATETSKLLSGPCVKALEAIDRLSSQQISLEADVRADKHPRGAMGLALDRAESRIDAISEMTQSK